MRCLLRTNIKERDLSRNIDCAISGLPIENGTKTRAFILAKARNPYLQTLYPTSHFFPLSTGIVGTFNNDKKTIENTVESETFRLAIDAFFKNFTGSTDELLEAITNSEIESVRTIEVLKSVKSDISLCYIREDVYQKMISLSYNYSSNDPAVDTNFSFDKESVKEEINMIRGIVERAPDFTSRSRSKEEAQQLTNSYIEMFLETEYRVNASKKFKRTTLHSLFQTQEGSFWVQNLHPYKDVLFDKIRNPHVTDDEIAEFAINVLELIQTNLTMNGLGKTWQPSSDMLGQTTPYALQHEFALSIAEITKNALNDKARQEPNDPEHYKAWRKKRHGAAKNKK